MIFFIIVVISTLVVSTRCCQWKFCIVHPDIDEQDYFNMGEIDLFDSNYSADDVEMTEEQWEDIKKNGRRAIILSP